MYVFDTSPFITLFKNYYKARFPSLWTRFDALIVNETIVSTREVLREIQVGSTITLTEWANCNQSVFHMPVTNETNFIKNIFSVPHFQQNIEQQKILKGGSIADPFVIAKAYAEHKTVVTVEKSKPNSAKIPNICSHFGIECLSLEEFMEAENWVF